MPSDPIWQATPHRKDPANVNHAVGTATRTTRVPSRASVSKPLHCRPTVVVGGGRRGSYPRTSSIRQNDIGRDVSPTSDI